MGSGRGDRNQVEETVHRTLVVWVLQWGPVVVTGIRCSHTSALPLRFTLQWGPVVVTGISRAVRGAKGAKMALQWGPVVVTGISGSLAASLFLLPGFNGVRSW